MDARPDPDAVLGMDEIDDIIMKIDSDDEDVVYARNSNDNVDDDGLVESGVGGNDSTSNNHSLPVPEEVRTESVIAAHRRRQEEDSRATFKKNRRLTLLVWAGSICAFIVILATLVAFLTKGERDTKVATIEIQEGRVDDIDPEAWAQVITLLRTYTPAEKLAQHNSPQNRAAAWLTREVMDGKSEVPPDRDYDDAYVFVQRYIMATFYYALNGLHWNHNFKFLSDADVCDWNGEGYDVELATFSTSLKIQNSITLGVDCNEDGEITYVFLPANGLKGEIPPETGLLEAIQTFAVYHNEISGQLPDALKYWNDLEEIFLENNQLSGPIPSWIGDAWPWLELASFAYNQLSGSLPNSFQNLENLEAIALNDNQFTGSIDILGKAKKLEVLFLQNNKFNGIISPDTFSELESMHILDASNNQLQGQLSSHFFGLKILDVHHNKIGGSLPEIDHDGYGIEFLSVYGNQLVGEIPLNIGDLTLLTHVDLSGNSLSGIIPGSLNTLANLKHLYLGNNKYSEQPFPSLNDCTNLKELSLRSSNIAATIPHWIGNKLSNLVLLDLTDNKLYDVIPENLGFLESLRFLLLGRNQLNGQVADRLSQLQDLQMLTVDHNSNLTGSIGAVCADNGPQQLDHVLADCSLICSCCDKCCDTKDGACGSEVLTPNLDGPYQRVTFKFSDALVFDGN